MLRATEFEFRHRFWMIGAIYFAGFALYNIDHVNIVQYAIDRTVGGNAPNSLFHAVFAFAASLAFLAALLRTWGTAYLRTEVVQDPNLRSEAIVADGPYRHVRNPLYLGGILLGVSLAFLASRIGAVVIVVGLTLFYGRLTGLEEAKLEREQGERYREFCRRVPRLFPSIRPRLPASGLEPKWGQAFWGEMFMWGFFVGVAAFAITLKIVVTWILWGVALVFYIVRSYVIYAKRRPARSS